MRTIQENVDVLVPGGGTAGHVAALQAAREGVRTAVIEAGSMLGGTMTAGGVAMPNHFFSRHGPVVQGIAWGLFCRSKEVQGLSVPDWRKRRPVETPGYYSYINVPVYAAVAEEAALKAGLVLHYHEFISEVQACGDFWEVTSLGRGVKRITTARELIDCSGDCDVVRALGLPVLYDDTRQPGSLQYTIEGIEHEEIWEQEVQVLYEEALEAGLIEKGDFAYPNILPFKEFLDRGGHNCSHIYEADTSNSEGQTRVNIEGRVRMLRMFNFLRSAIPGCERAAIKTMAPYALARETYRSLREYVISKQDFLEARDFEDSVCNAFNYVDMHSREQGCELTFHPDETLLPTVPFRALIPKGSSRLTVAGRIVSAERFALAGVRAQCTCMAMGQAMGAAAALAVRKKLPSRDIPSQDIVALTVEHGAVPLQT